MECNARFISFPPYLCAPWGTIASISLQLHPEEDYEALTLTLHSGEKLLLPELMPGQVAAIYEAYRSYLARSGAKRSALLPSASSPSSIAKSRSLQGESPHQQRERPAAPLLSPAPSKATSKTPPKTTSTSEAPPKPLKDPSSSLPSSQSTTLRSWKNNVRHEQTSLDKSERPSFSKTNMERKQRRDQALFTAEQLREILSRSSEETLKQLVQLQQGMPVHPLRASPLAHFVLLSETPSREETTILRHDPQASRSPSLPKELLRKIRAFSRRVLSQQEISDPPKAHQGCNCSYCQIARAIEEGLDADETRSSAQEQITENELRFSSWRVKPLGDDCFELTDPDDATKAYRVEMRPKPRCSCGEPHCSHIETILKDY